MKITEIISKLAINEFVVLEYDGFNLMQWSKHNMNEWNAVKEKLLKTHEASYAPSSIVRFAPKQAYSTISYEVRKARRGNENVFLSN